MRCDQFMGLPAQAGKFLKANMIPEEICPCCKRSLSPLANSYVIDHYHGMFNDCYDLYRHKLKDGGCADEFVQAMPFSSGPVFFLGLRVYDVKGEQTREFLWSQKEIDEC